MVTSGVTAWAAAAKRVQQKYDRGSAVGSSRQEEAAASKLSLVLARSPIADHQNLSRCRPGGTQPFLSPAEQDSSSLSLAPKGFRSTSPRESCTAYVFPCFGPLTTRRIPRCSSESFEQFI